MRTRAGSRIVIAGLAVTVLVGGLAIGVLARSTAPSSPEEIEPTRDQIAVAQEGVDAGRPRHLRDRLAMQVRSTKAGIKEFCTTLSAPDLIVLGHIMSCRDKLIIMRPDRVDCGPIHGRTTLDAFVAALLQHPVLHATDVGPITPGVNVPAGLFRVAPAGRIIDVATAKRADATTAGADPCRLSAPRRVDGDGTVKTDEIDIRGDKPARLILVEDPDGTLLVFGVLLTGEGHGGDNGASTRDHMLEQIYDVTMK